MPPAAVAGLQGAPGRQAGVGGLGAMSLGMRTPSPCRVVGGASWPGLARPWTGPLGHSMPPRHTSARALPLGAPPADHIRQLQADLADPTKVVCAQTAPAVRVAIAEEFGLPPGATSAGQLVAALRALHFDYVFDVALGADLTIMEEGAELLERMTARARGEAGAPLPLLTSCCPGWVSLVEKAHPDLIPHLSTCRSPHMMLGRVLKAYFAPAAGIDPANLVVCSVMPCVRKQGEADRPWYALVGQRDVDHVITTHELGGLLQGVDLAALAPSPYDDPLGPPGSQSGSGVLFGTTGGVMEAALRTVAEQVSGVPMERLEFEAVRGLEGVKEATVSLAPAPGSPLAPAGGGLLELHVAVANGLGAAKKLVQAVRDGSKHYDFVEVMACPGGCISGGGQPRSVDRDITAKRQKAIYSLDAGAAIRRSHSNPAVQSLYERFLGYPLSPAAELHLHTHYVPGGVEGGDGAAALGGGGGGPGAAEKPGADFPAADPSPLLTPAAATAADAHAGLADVLAHRAQSMAPPREGCHVCEFCGAHVDCHEGVGTEGGAGQGA